MFTRFGTKPQSSDRRGMLEYLQHRYLTENEVLAEKKPIKTFKGFEKVNINKLLFNGGGTQ